MRLFRIARVNKTSLQRSGLVLKSPLNTQEAIQMKATCRRLIKARINDFTEDLITITENCNKDTTNLNSSYRPRHDTKYRSNEDKTTQLPHKDRTETDSTTTRQRQKATQSRQELGEEYFFSPSRRNRNSATVLRTETFRYTETDTDRGYRIQC